MTQRVMSLADSLRDPRADLYRQLLEQGISTAPVGHWTQGLARLAQTAAGLYGQKKLRDEQRAVAEALAGIGGDGAPIGQDENARLLAEMQADNEALTGVPATPGETAGYAQGLGMGAPMGGGQPTTPKTDALRRLQALPPSPYRDQAILQERQREQQALAAQEAARKEQELWMSRFNTKQVASQAATREKREYETGREQEKLGRQLTLDEIRHNRELEKLKAQREYEKKDFEVKRVAELEDYKKKLEIKGGMDVGKVIKEDPEKLRKEYTSINKDFINSRDAYARVISSAKDPSPAGDLAMIFNYMKVLDPGSVVRESEFATAAQTGSFGERIKAAVQRVQSGERLSDEMRQDFVDRAGDLFQSQLDIYYNTRKIFQGVAERGGLTGESSIIDLTGGVRVPRRRKGDFPAPPPGFEVR